MTKAGAFAAATLVLTFVPPQAAQPQQTWDEPLPPQVGAQQQQQQAVQEAQQAVREAQEALQQGDIEAAAQALQEAEQVLEQEQILEQQLDDPLPPEAGGRAGGDEQPGSEQQM